MITANDRELKECLKELERMAKSLRKSEVNKMKRAAAGPMVARMKAAAPSAQLSAAVGVTVAKGKAGGAATAMKIGVIKDTGEKGGLSTPALASITEYGSADRVQHTTGRFTGKVTGAPWLRPAWDTGVNTLIQTFEQSLIKAVEKK